MAMIRPLQAQEGQARFPIQATLTEAYRWRGGGWGAGCFGMTILFELRKCRRRDFGSHVRQNLFSRPVCRYEQAHETIHRPALAMPRLSQCVQ